jgi:hypothetical protein
MGTKNADVTAYITRAQPFARPILTKIRALFHRASPLIEEKLKWGMPSFEHNGIVGMMAGFKQHARWGLWKSKQLDDPRDAVAGGSSSTMGMNKVTSLADLPGDDVIIDLIKQAVALNARGGVKRSAPRTGGAAANATASRAKVKPRPAPKPPADLAAALKKNAKAATTFKNFSPSHRREYIEWITEARQPETRQRRLAQTIEWLAEGKPRNWKYMKRKA